MSTPARHRLRPSAQARHGAQGARAALGTLAIAAGLACGLAPAPAGASDVHWSPQCGDGDWDSFCWSLSAGGAPLLFRPAAGDAAWLQRDGQRLQLSFGGGAAVPVPAALSRLTLDGRHSGAVELTVLKGQLQADAMVLGASGRSAIFQQGGLVHVGGDLVLGQAAGSQGHYRLDGGALSVDGRIKQSEGRGTLVLAGGSLTAAAGIAVDTLSFEAGAQPRSEVARWDADTRRTVIGQQGRVTLVRDSGQHRVREDLVIGDGSVLDLRGGRFVVDGAVQGQGSGSVLQIGAGELQVRGDIGVGLFKMVGPAGKTSRFTLAEGQRLQTQHSWLGQAGSTEFLQEGGTHAVASDLLLGITSAAQTTYWLRGGRLDVGGNVTHGGGAATLVIDGGQLNFAATLQAHQLLVGEGAGRRGELALGPTTSTSVQHLVVGGQGEGQLRNASTWLYVHQGLVLGRDAGSVGRLQTENGNLTAYGTVTVGQQGTAELGIAGGLVATHGLTIAAEPGASGRVTLTGGQLLVDGPVSGGLGNSRIDLDGGMLSADHVAVSRITLASSAGSRGSHRVAAGRSLWTQRLDLGLAGEGTLTLDGGSLEVWGDARVGGLAGSQGTWLQHAGDARVQGDLVLGADGGSGALQLAGGTLAVQGALRRGSGFASIEVQGGLLQVGTPRVTVDQLLVGPLARWELPTTVTQTLQNEGWLQAPRLQIDGTLVNRGQLVLTGGEIDGAGRWAQSGSFTGHGRIALAGGIDNSGTMRFEQGPGTLASALTVAATGRVEVATGATLQVQGLAAFAPRAVLSIEQGAEASFEAGLHWSTGAVRSGGGRWQLGGEVGFDGTPAALEAAGTLVLGSSARTTLRLGATGHDALHAGQALTLGGTLVLLPWDGFQPEAGARYDLLDWGTLAGRFEAIDLSALPTPAGLRWDSAALYTRGEIGLVTLSPVPEPGGWAMLAAGLGVLGFIVRRRSPAPGRA